MSTISARRAQEGATYVEVLIATLLLAIALVPAIEALHTGVLGVSVNADMSDTHYAAMSRAEEVLAEPYSLLLVSAGGAGDVETPASYSDPSGSTDRIVVYLGRYDPDNVDGDGDPFTVPDPDVDGDGDPFTGYGGLLWLRVEIEGTLIAFATLVAP